MDNRQGNRNMQEEVKKIPYDELYFLRYATEASTENDLKISLYQKELENRRRNVEIINTTLLRAKPKNNVSEQNQVYMRQGNGINLFRIYDIDVIHKLLQDSRATDPATDPYTRQDFTAKDVKFVYPKKHDVRMFEDGETMITMHLMYGILHFERDEPALIKTKTDGTKLFDEYYEKGVKKGEITYIDGRKHKEEWFNEYGRRHRDGDKPAVCWWYEGILQRQEWWKNGKEHRDGDKPAECTWLYNSTHQEQIWWKNGKIHRDGDKPALCEFYEKNMNPVRQVWLKNGQIHRAGDKPAYCEWSEDGKIKVKAWYENGRKLREIKY
jgi:antitoxin component YwqK of YwqJK toxin-antitoxin module